MRSASRATSRDREAHLNSGGNEAMITRSTLLALAWGALALMPARAPDLPTQNLAVFGGAGGTAFSRSCGAGRVLSGLRYRAGLSLDAIGLLCRPVNANGSLGSETSVGAMAGGPGGTFAVARCRTGLVVHGAYFRYGAVIDGLQMHCVPWHPDSRSFYGVGGVFYIGRTEGNNSGNAFCEAQTQPVVAIRGRAGLVVDAIGLTCDEP
jgi:hypothetical protein